MPLSTFGTTILREPSNHTGTRISDSTSIMEEAVGRMKLRAQEERCKLISGAIKKLSDTAEVFN